MSNKAEFVVTVATLGVMLTIVMVVIINVAKLLMMGKAGMTRVTSAVWQSLAKVRRQVSKKAEFVVALAVVVIVSVIPVVVTSVVKTLMTEKARMTSALRRSTLKVQLLVSEMAELVIAVTGLGVTIIIVLVVIGSSNSSSKVVLTTTRKTAVPRLNKSIKVTAVLRQYKWNVT